MGSEMCIRDRLGSRHMSDEAPVAECRYSDAHDDPRKVASDLVTVFCIGGLPVCACLTSLMICDRTVSLPTLVVATLSDPDFSMVPAITESPAS